MAAFVVSFGETLASTFTRRDASLTPDERKLIEPATTRMLARIPAETVGRANTILDPLMLLLGVSMWLGRLGVLSPKLRVNGVPVATARDVSDTYSAGRDSSPPAYPAPNGSAATTGASFGVPPDVRTFGGAL